MSTVETELGDPYPLAREEITGFEEKGFVRLRQVLSPTILQAYGTEITRRVIELNTMHVPMDERSTYDKAFLQVWNLWTRSEVVQRLAFSPRLARIATELLGVDGVRLYHDQALYKEAGGGLTPWHADQYYWPLSSDRVCTVWIPLQDTPVGLGALEFAAGSHRIDIGRNLVISDESEERIEERIREEHCEISQSDYRMGDVSYHLGWTFHRAPANPTSYQRRVMTVIYMDADIRVVEPTNDHQRTDIDRWMPGTEIGAIPDTQLNPVLYQR